MRNFEKIVPDINANALELCLSCTNPLIYDVTATYTHIFQAVCCEDHLHCCPSGSQCNLANLQCTSSSADSTIERNVPMKVKLPTISDPSRDLAVVTCPDLMSSCPDADTCCLTNGGSYGCCPFPNVRPRNIEKKPTICKPSTSILH